METGARFYVRPPLRCFERQEDQPGGVCGAPANWIRPAPTPIGCSYFCDAHARPGDHGIGDVAVFRRVAVNLELLLAGTSWTETEAHAEAVARLERALEPIGAVIHLRTVRSEVGQNRPQTPTGATGPGVGAPVGR